jgi:hypothetical protein
MTDTTPIMIIGETSETTDEELAAIISTVEIEKTDDLINQAPERKE